MEAVDPPRASDGNHGRFKLIAALGAVPYQQDQGQSFAFASETNNSVGCCAQGFLPSTAHVCWGYSGGVFPGRKYACSPAACAGSYPNTSSDFPYCGTSVACPRGQWLSSPGGTPCANCAGVCACSSWTQAQTYTTYWLYRQLSQASESVSGSWVPVTRPSDVDGNVYGVPNTEATPITLSGTVNH